MLTNFPASFSTPKPPKSKTHLTIKKNLSEVVDKLTSTHRKMGMRLHFCTTYKWIDNHYVLLIMVTSSTLNIMKGATTNVALVASNNTTCMIFAISHLDVSDQCFLETLLTFKSWNRSFRSSYFVMGCPWVRRWKIATNCTYFHPCSQGTSTWSCSKIDGQSLIV